MAEVLVYAEDEEDILDMGWSKEDMEAIRWRDCDGDDYIAEVKKIPHLYTTANPYEIQVVDIVPGKPRVRKK